MSEIYVCPGCGQPVADEETYLVAQEYELARGFSERTNVVTKDDLAAGSRRRFHPTHFRDRIGKYLYEVLPEDDSSPAEDLGA